MVLHADTAFGADGVPIPTASRPLFQVVTSQPEKARLVFIFSGTNPNHLHPNLYPELCVHRTNGAEGQR